MPEETQKIIEVPEAPAAKPEPKKTPKPLPGRSYPGALIVVEGTDGSGKSTQLYLLKRWLEIGGAPVPAPPWHTSPLLRASAPPAHKPHPLHPTPRPSLHA